MDHLHQSHSEERKRKRKKKSTVAVKTTTPRMKFRKSKPLWYRAYHNQINRGFNMNEDTAKTLSESKFTHLHLGNVPEGTAPFSVDDLVCLEAVAQGDQGFRQRASQSGA
jgi:hypothetical protein